MQRDQLFRQDWKPLGIAARKTIIDLDGPALDPSESCKTFAESGELFPRFCVVGGNCHKHPDPPRLSLLRARQKRPRRRAADQHDELAPPHSITSSARASSDGGTSRPSRLEYFWVHENSDRHGMGP